MEVIYIKIVTRIKSESRPRWRGNQNNQSSQNYGWSNDQNSIPPLQASKSPLEKKAYLEEALAHMMTSHSTFMNETKATFQNQAQQLQNQST